MRARFTVRGYNAHGTQRYAVKPGRVIVRVATKYMCDVAHRRLKRVSSVGEMRFRNKTVIDIIFWIIGSVTPGSLRVIDSSQVEEFSQRKRGLWVKVTIVL